MSDVIYIVETLGSSLVLILAAPMAFQLTLNPPVQNTLVLQPQPSITAILAAPVHPVLQIVQQQITMQVNLSTGGVRGMQGIQGVRGSLFLGKYPTFSTLPAVDGESIKNGDYAYLSDTGEMWILKD